MGVDLGDHWSHYCMIEEAEVLGEGKFRTTPAEFESFFGSRSKIRVAIEAGPHSPWASRAIAEQGHEVLVANPRYLRSIYQNPTKSDRVDAEQLARLACSDPNLLHPIQHRGPEAQQDLAILRSRDGLVAARTKLVNNVRGVVKTTGHRIAACSTHCFATRASSQVPEMMRPATTPILESIALINTQIAAFDRTVEKLAEEKYPETAVLRQVPGVGALTAVAFILTLEDKGRFPNSRQAGAFLGLHPRKDQSGRRDRQLPITKCGDVFLRRLLVGSAHYILGPFGPDTDLRRWGLKLASRGGGNAKKRAVVAVARKLAMVLHHLWVTGERYVPLKDAPPAAEDSHATTAEPGATPIAAAPQPQPAQPPSQTVPAADEAGAPAQPTSKTRSHRVRPSARPPVPPEGAGASSGSKRVYVMRKWHKTGAAPASGKPGPQGVR